MAPTSTSRVGSSKMISSGFLHQRFGDHHFLRVSARQLDDLYVTADRANVQFLDPCFCRPYLPLAGDRKKRLFGNLARNPR